MGPRLAWGAGQTKVEMLPLLGAGLKGSTNTLLRGPEKHSLTCGSLKLGLPSSQVSSPCWKTTQRSREQRIRGPRACNEAGQGPPKFLDIQAYICARHTYMYYLYKNYMHLNIVTVTHYITGQAEQDLQEGNLVSVEGVTHK